MKKKHWSSMPFCKPLTLTHWVNFLRVLVGWVTEKIFLLPTSVYHPSSVAACEKKLLVSVFNVKLW